jgi:hypothetical protein
MEKNLEGVFSRALSGVKHTKDVWICIHMNMDEYDHFNLMKFREEVLIGDDFKLKPKYVSLMEKKLDVWNEFPNFYYEDEWEKYVLSRIHEKFMWLDIPHIIKKDSIRVVIGLCSIRLVMALKEVKKEVVMKLINEKFDNFSLIVNNIDDPIVKYSSIILCYKILYTKK